MCILWLITYAQKGSTGITLHSEFESGIFQFKLRRTMSEF